LIDRNVVRQTQFGGFTDEHNHNEYGIPKICHELLVEGRWGDGSTLPDKSML
jgi:hypothetical protein